MSPMSPGPKRKKAAAEKVGPKRAKARVVVPDPAVIKAMHEGLGPQYDGWKEAVGGMRRDQLERELVRRRVISDEDSRKVNVSWLRHRLIYAMQEEWRNSLGVETPARIQEAIDKLDESRKLPRWHVDIFTGQHIGDTDMAKKNAAKSEKPQRKTIGSFMVEVLRRSTVPTNEEIVALVKKEFPDSKFDGKHCSWYKGAFNAGKLPGQTKKEAFNQPEVRTAKEEKEPASKGKGKKVAPKASKKAAKKGGPKRKAATASTTAQASEAATA